MGFPSIQSRFAAQAARTPDATAVVCGDVLLSYRELNDRANQLANRLRSLGVRSENPVAVLMEHSADLVVALLAILKAGAFYLPLHSAYPRDRMQRIMDHAGGPILLVDSAMQRGETPTARVTIAVDVDQATAGMPRTDPASPTTSGDTAYVMHTSGSTGEPLGVAVPHRAVLELVADPCWDSGRHLRVLAVAPYAYSVSTYELWVPLLRGGQVVIAPSREVDARSLRHRISEHGITGLHLTAGLFRVLAEESPECLTGVQEVLTGGDVISAAAVRRVLDACPGIVVRSMYGATELSLFATSVPIPRPEPGSGVPLGRAMAGVRLYVLDGNHQPVPDGAVGELYVGGSRLAIGYYGRPDLTAERFVDDPFAGVGNRMYRTGDLVRMTGDGLVEFVSRVTDQVKIRGFRVEPVEVENVLAGQPGVAHTAVVARVAPSGEKRLVAYVVTDGAPLDLAALRAHTRAELPDYMVPAAFVEVDALPLTANGKVDRRALPEPDFDEIAGYQPPATERQELLCALFAEVLATDQVGIDDSFLDLGGQSMLAVRLATRIGKALGVEVGVSDVFNAPTVRELDIWLNSRVPAATT
ncbi:non-ribosomal peptide synthetase [Amycolatopsis cihanbeyliensis]|uniref:Amino acid adenylation domain-containing protein n=1 Tax=Amycolatopsis cihanbeyliensis TaxID=1128664 RepID=A0A542DQB5_AMYCI|nr:non-ribosomal peptide synthetase [Amycolatopsis cihanbeyliensis]TQJ05246.1 amino acid adenylation domain-containing protein [Amycolatopsis cihanbeyliensis]